MAILSDFLCPGCFMREYLPDNKTGRDTLMCGDFQQMVDIKSKEFYRLLIPRKLWNADQEKYNAAVEQFVEDFIRYGREVLSHEDTDSMKPLDEPIYRVWANRAKFWQCPRCGRRMIKVSDALIMAD